MNLSAALSLEGLADLLAHPHLMAVGDAVARAHVLSMSEMDPETRWLNADVGRASLCVTLVMLDATVGATGAGLIASAQAYGVCSRGRVLSFLHYAQARGRIVIPAGHEPWTQRRLIVSSSFEAPQARMTAARVRAMAGLDPALARVADRLDEPGGHKRFMAATALMMAVEPAAFAGPPTPITHFLQRDGGMDILRALTVGQPAERSRFLDIAPLSRLRLARNSNVSRTQVSRVLDEAQAAGLLTVTKDQVVFSPELSDDALRHLAFTTRTVQLAAAAGGLMD